MRTWIIALAVAIATAGGIAIPVDSAVAQTAQDATTTQTQNQTQTPAQKIPVVIGTLDVQQVVKQSKAGQSLEAILVAKSKAMNADIGQTEQNLRAKRQQLDQARSSLSPADYEAKRADLDKQFDAFRKNAIAKRKELAALNNKGLDQIIKTADAVIREIAQKKGLTLIVNKSMVVMAAENWDITAEVLKSLDAKLPKVNL